VSSSPESTKRAFLEKKGLTGDEIEEAFRRAPEPAAKTAGAPPAAKPAPPTTSSAARTPPAAVPGRAADRHPESESGPRWTQVLLRAGFFAAAASCAYKNVRGGQSGAGRSAPGPAARRDEGSRDDANAQEANAANAQGPNSATKPREDGGASPDPSHRSFVAANRHVAELETSLERAKSEAESFRSLLAAARTSADASAAAGAGTFPEITRAVESVARELREEIRDAVAAAVADLSASASASGAPGGGGAGASPSSRGGGGYRDTGSMMMPGAAAPVAGTPPGSVVGESEAASVRRELAAIRSMLDASPLLATTPPREGDSNDNPYGAYAVPPTTATPRYAAGSEAGSAAPLKTTPRLVDATPAGPPPGGSAVERPSPKTSEDAATASSSAAHSEPPHPTSYRRVLEMLEKGETPPGIRDIDDKPPNPDARPNPSTMARRAKPWERRDSGRRGFGGGRGGAEAGGGGASGGGGFDSEGDGRFGYFPSGDAAGAKPWEPRRGGGGFGGGDFAEISSAAEKGKGAAGEGGGGFGGGGGRVAASAGAVDVQRGERGGARGRRGEAGRAGGGVGERVGGLEGWRERA
jgi:hypothetical protein